MSPHARARLGISRWLLPLPGALWRRQIIGAAGSIAAENRHFMSAEHRRVHHAAVRELPHFGSTPLDAKRLAEIAKVSLERTEGILDDLERRMTFLVRDRSGAVRWAYPVTIDTTPHHVTFKTGERLDAA